jgi:hypothetical protein
VKGEASTVWVGKQSPHNRDILLTGRRKVEGEASTFLSGNTHHITGIYSSQVGEKCR